MATMGIYMFFNGLAVLIVAFILITIVDDDKPKKRDKSEMQHEEVHKEASDVRYRYEYYIPESTPAEEALLATNRQSLQLNMGALEAHRLLAEAAKRHEHDPAPSSWYVDAEWNV